MNRHALLWPLTLATLVVADPGAADEPTRGLTAVPGIKVGHHTMEERPTGVTVVLAEDGAVAGVDVRGGAPGTREIALLDPVNSVQEIHAVVLSGGSAFGLDSATGVMRYLEEKGVGYATSVAKVPIVPAAILFDLAVGNAKIRPDAEAGYRAAKKATDGAIAEGNVGAGAGATVGKVRGMDRAMKSGVGSAAADGPEGLVVAALVAVNAVGQIVDPATGEVVAGMRGDDGRLADLRRLLGPEAPPPPARPLENTTLGVVATNARLTKAQATKVAQMAHDGLARSIYPVHTAWDGDTIFVLATGESGAVADPSTVGALAAQVVAEAVLRAVRAAEGLPGLPAARDLGGAED